MTPASAMSDALQQIILQRKLEARQAMLDRMAQEAAAQNKLHQDRTFGLDQDRLAETRRVNDDSLMTAGLDRRLKTADSIPADQDVAGMTPEIRDILTGLGRTRGVDFQGPTEDGGNLPSKLMSMGSMKTIEDRAKLADTEQAKRQAYENARAILENSAGVTPDMLRAADFANAGGTGNVLDENLQVLDEATNKLGPKVNLGPNANVIKRDAPTPFRPAPKQDTGVFEDDKGQLWSRQFNPNNGAYENVRIADNLKPVSGRSASNMKKSDVNEGSLGIPKSAENAFIRANEALVKNPKPTSPAGIAARNQVERTAADLINNTNGKLLKASEKADIVKARNKYSNGQIVPQKDEDGVMMTSYNTMLQQVADNLWLLRGEPAENTPEYQTYLDAFEAAKLLLQRTVIEPPEVK